MQDGYGESRSFSGAGLGASKDVATLNSGGDGVFLDRGWDGVTEIVDRAQYWRGDAERFKSHALYRGRIPGPKRCRRKQQL